MKLIKNTFSECHIPIPRQEWRKRELLLWFLGQIKMPEQESIREKLQQVAGTIKWKCRWPHIQDEAEENENQDAHIFIQDSEDFLQAPSQETIAEVTKAFIQHTGNEALRTVVCAVCAREMFTQECSPINVVDLPHTHWLKPAIIHPAHSLHGELLLWQQGLAQWVKQN
jgi:hypothetical protein